MTQIIRAREVTRPTPTPIRSSVLDHATVVTMTDGFGMRNEAGMWPSYNCLDTLVPWPLCPDPVNGDETTEPKVFSTVPWIPGFSFAVYGGVECSAVGLDTDDQHDEVERVFKASEGKGVERALLLNRFVARAATPGLSGPDAVSWDAPVDLTPVGGVDLKVALALLEGYARSIYAGVPTLHLPAAAASLLGSDKIVWENGLAYTRLGSKVAIGGGYDHDYEAGPIDGTWDLYATGEVYVEQSEQIVQSAYVIPGDNALAVGALADNTHITLAERAYRAAVDCFVARATGTVFA